jgi:hypothetical protein
LLSVSDDEAIQPATTKNVVVVTLAAAMDPIPLAKRPEPRRRLHLPTLLNQRPTARRASNQ